MYLVIFSQKCISFNKFSFKLGTCNEGDEWFPATSQLKYRKLDPVSRVTGTPGWYWILGIKCSDTTGVGLV